MSEKHLGLIARIKTLKEITCEEISHGQSHNLTCVILAEEQVNNKIGAY